MASVNCWEYKKCGREPGGLNCGEFGACPSATSEEYDGSNSGRNGGRRCWRIAGTMCTGEVAGTFVHKASHCGKCDFYETVREEEGDSFVV